MCCPVGIVAASPGIHGSSEDGEIRKDFKASPRLVRRRHPLINLHKKLYLTSKIVSRVPLHCFPPRTQSKTGRQFRRPDHGVKGDFRFVADARIPPVLSRIIVTSREVVVDNDVGSRFRRVLFMIVVLLEEPVCVPL